MQSTKSKPMIAFLISPSPDWLEDIEPLAKTKPAIPPGARWFIMCSTQAKLAFPTGGIPYFQRTSSRRRSPPQSLMLNGGVAREKYRFRSGGRVLLDVSPVGGARVAPNS